jgi:hypothetical protein
MVDKSSGYNDLPIRLYPSQVILHAPISRAHLQALLEKTRASLGLLLLPRL